MREKKEARTPRAFWQDCRQAVTREKMARTQRTCWRDCRYAVMRERRRRAHQERVGEIADR